MPRMSRSTRRTIRKVNDGVRDFKGYIDENPVTSAVLALAAGVIGTSVVKMTMGKPSVVKKTTGKPKAQPPVKRVGRKSKSGGRTKTK